MLLGVLAEEGEPQQDGDEAGARMRSLIMESYPDTRELGRIRSREPHNRSTLICRLTCYWPSRLRTRPRQPLAYTVAEGYRLTMLAMPFGLLELHETPVSTKQAKCKYLDAHLSAVLASGYAVIEMPGARLESNDAESRSRQANNASVALVMLSICFVSSSRVSQLYCPSAMRTSWMFTLQVDRHSQNSQRAYSRFELPFRLARAIAATLLAR